MTLAATKARQDMTFVRDVPVRLTPWLMLAGNPELRTMTVERFERELRAFANKIIVELDQDGDGGIGTTEIDRMLLDIIEAQAGNDDFQSGPGGDAMRAHVHKLRREYYASLDLDGDGVFTADEMLESDADAHGGGICAAQDVRIRFDGASGWAGTCCWRSSAKS